jgi:hypothetical protein
VLIVDNIVAQICFFIANENLGMVVVFPITSAGPGVVASLWSLFLFKEIKGKRNFRLMTLSFSVTALAMVMIVLSKVA